MSTQVRVTPRRRDTRYPVRGYVRRPAPERPVAPPIEVWEVGSKRLPGYLAGLAALATAAIFFWPPAIIAAFLGWIGCLASRSSPYEIGVDRGRGRIVATSVANVRTYALADAQELVRHERVGSGKLDHFTLRFRNGAVTLWADVEPRFETIRALVPAVPVKYEIYDPDPD